MQARPDPADETIHALLDPARPMDGKVRNLLLTLLSLADEDLAFIPYHAPRTPSGSASMPSPADDAFKAGQAAGTTGVAGAGVGARALRASMSVCTAATSDE